MAGAPTRTGRPDRARMSLPPVMPARRPRDTRGGDGRSPGLRVQARTPGLPGGIPPVAEMGAGSPPTVAGTAAAWAPGRRTAFPLRRRPFRERPPGTVARHHRDRGTAGQAARKKGAIPAGGRMAPEVIRQGDVREETLVVVQGKTVVSQSWSSVMSGLDQPPEGAVVGAGVVLIGWAPVAASASLLTASCDLKAGICSSCSGVTEAIRACSAGSAFN